MRAELPDNVLSFALSMTAMLSSSIDLRASRPPQPSKGGPLSAFIVLQRWVDLGYISGFGLSLKQQSLVSGWIVNSIVEEGRLGPKWGVKRGRGDEVVPGSDAGTSCHTLMSSAEGSTSSSSVGSPPVQQEGRVSQLMRVGWTRTHGASSSR